MKRVVLACLLLLPLSSIAAEYPCVFLDIRLKNQMKTACHLVNFNLISGAIPMSKKINNLPLTIDPGQMTPPFTISELGWDETADLSLTYDCGENKKITIESQKGLCRRSAVVNGIALSTSSMTATAETMDGLYWEGRSGSITWTFSEI